MTKEIAWICNKAMYVLPYQVEIGFNLKVSHQHYKQADEALEGLKKKKFDLVVLDPWLASGDNYPVKISSCGVPDYNKIVLDLVGRIKQDTPNQKTPIVILTSSIKLREKPLKEQFEKQGVSEIIETSTLPNAFYNVVKEYLK